MLSGSYVIPSPHNVTLFHIHGVDWADEKREEKEDKSERHCYDNGLICVDSEILCWASLMLSVPLVTEHNPRQYAMFKEIHYCN